MTAAARITQADIARATKVAAKHEGARVVLDLAAGKIEIVFGEPGGSEPDLGEWSDDDV